MCLVLIIYVLITMDNFLVMVGLGINLELSPFGGGETMVSLSACNKVHPPRPRSDDASLYRREVCERWRVPRFGSSGLAFCYAGLSRSQCPAENNCTAYSPCGACIS